MANEFIFDGAALEMPQVDEDAFHRQLDDFLATPGPNVDVFRKGNGPDNVALPKLRKERTALRLEEHLPRNRNAMRKKAEKHRAKTGAIKPLNVDLLAEAMQYADNLKAAEVINTQRGERNPPRKGPKQYASRPPASASASMPHKRNEAKERRSKSASSSTKRLGIIAKVLIIYLPFVLCVQTAGEKRKPRRRRPAGQVQNSTPLLQGTLTRRGAGWIWGRLTS
jgi:hypothetical protein